MSSQVDVSRRDRQRMTDYDLPTDDEYPTISSIYQKLIEFLRTLRQEVNRDEFKKLIFGKTTMNSDALSFKFQPHAYTQANLVFPLLDTLGIEYQPEPLIHSQDENRRPDFELTNTDIPLIGETKPINDIGAGVDQIKRYLSTEEVETPYGILTDGIDWRVYGPSPEGSSGGLVLRESVSIRESLPTLTTRCDIQEISAYTEDARMDLLIPMTRFVRIFKRKNLNRWTLLGLSKEEREKFMSADTHFQRSISEY